MFDAVKAVGIGAAHRAEQDDGPKANDPRLLPDKALQRTAKVTRGDGQETRVHPQRLKETSPGLPTVSI